LLAQVDTLEVGLINTQKPIFNDETQQILKVLPRFNLGVVDRPHEFLLALFCRNHHHVDIAIALHPLDGKIVF
jgi:hypothetical protein